MLLRSVQQTNVTVHFAFRFHPGDWSLYLGSTTQEGVLPDDVA